MNGLSDTRPPGRRTVSRSRASDNAGIMLVGLVLAILVASLLAGGLLMILGPAMMSAVETSEASDAQDAADTGLSLAQAYLATNETWFTNPPVITGRIGSAVFEVTFRSDATRLDGWVSSVGTDGSNVCTRTYRHVTRGMAIYAENNNATPRYRLVFASGALSAERYARAVGGNLRWQRVVANSTTNEFLLVTQDANRKVYAQWFTNGVWSAATNLSGQTTVNNAAYRGFDVAYEDLTGRALVVYSINGTRPSYRLFQNGSWSAPGTMTNALGGVAGPIAWVRLVPRPASSNILCLLRWSAAGSGPYSAAVIWNGSDWVRSQLLENNTGAPLAYETFDGAWSSNRALVVYINGSGTARRVPKHRWYNGASWGAEQATWPSVGALPRWIRMTFDSEGTQAFAAVANASGTLRGIPWDGTNWGTTYTNFGTLETTTYRCFDVAWSPMDNTLLVIYGRQNDAAHAFMWQPAGGAARFGTLPATADARWSEVRADPVLNGFFYLAIDAASDVNAHGWDGTRWLLHPELEVSSLVTYNTISMAYRRTLPADIR